MRRAVGCLLLSAVAALAAAGCGGGSHPVDLHAVDWRQATIPGSVCGAKAPIHLRARGELSEVVVRSTRWRDWPRVEVDALWSGSHVVYGDLDGDGSDEAALIVDCNNGGGTADGQLAFAAVIYTAGPRGPRVVGVVTPQVRGQGEHVPLLRVSIRPGKVVSHEFFYGLDDGTCCASGRATTVWTYSGGRLEVTGARVTRKPSTRWPEVMRLHDGSSVSVWPGGRVLERGRAGAVLADSNCGSYARYERWVGVMTRFRKAVLTDDRAGVVSALARPFYWNHGGESTAISGPAQLSTDYESIFGRTVVREIANADPRALFCKDVTMVMLGSGVVWGDEAAGRTSIVAVNGLP
jgi:hypothetical protein